MKYMKFSDKANLILSISLIVLGTLFLIFPGQILNILFYVVGGIIFVYGIYNLIVDLTKNRNKYTDTSYKIAIGVDVTFMIVGVLFASLATFFLHLFIIILGIGLILFGLFDLYLSLNARLVDTTTRIISVASSLIFTFIGALLLIDLDKTTTWVMYLLGAIIIANGILILVKAIKDMKENKVESKIKDDNVIDVEIIEK